MALRGERATVKRHEDNLHLEGSFEGRRSNGVVLAGERAKVVRHEDNLRLEGKFEGKQVEAVALRGERAQIRKYEDNLHLEGQFEGRKQQQVFALFLLSTSTNISIYRAIHKSTHMVLTDPST